MLKQASISQLRHGEIDLEKDHLVVVMRTYPRGVKKESMHEYLSCLGPAADLFKDFKARQKEFGHEQAFIGCDYENRFQISQVGFVHLGRLAKLSTTQDVHLICQCERGEFCHRELLLLIAAQKFAVKVDEIHHPYENFKARLEDNSFLTSPSFWG